MTRYSVAIRTLGLNQMLLKQELISIKHQSIRPEKVVVYIAQGHKIPDYNICGEIYITTPKGMLTQRALDYNEISTRMILLLDDDVILAPDSVKKMIVALTKGGYHCIGADVYENHKLNLKSKIYAALTNLVFPHTDAKYAFKIHKSGSFSYINHPLADVMDSQSAAGPCSLWIKEKLLEINLEDERWIDSLEYPYNEDSLTFHKLWSNGGKLGVMFDCGVTHLNGRTSRLTYDDSMFLIRAKAQYALWHRMIFMSSDNKADKIFVFLSFWLKALWMIPIHITAAILYHKPGIPYFYIKGLIQGISFTNSSKYKGLNPYVHKCAP